MAPQLHRLRYPCLVVAGTVDNLLPSYEEASRLEKELPDCQVGSVGPWGGGSVLGWVGGCLECWECGSGQPAGFSDRSINTPTQKNTRAQVHLCEGAGHGGTLDQRVQVLDILKGWKPARDLLLAKAEAEAAAAPPPPVVEA